jgi:anaerobic selenocysteine-containing dehydrogenase
MTDFLNAKAIVLWASNVAETSIPDWCIMADAHKAGTPIVSIDPRFTPTSLSGSRRAASIACGSPRAFASRGAARRV